VPQPARVRAASNAAPAARARSGRPARPACGADRPAVTFSPLSCRRLILEPAPL